MLGCETDSSCSKSIVGYGNASLPPLHGFLSSVQLPTFSMIKLQLAGLGVGWRTERPSHLCISDVRLYFSAKSELECIPGLGYDAPHCPDRTHFVDSFQ